MKRIFFDILHLITYFFGAFFTFKKKVLLFCIPEHPNLGDQAQLMCTEKWIKNNYGNYKLFEFPLICQVFANDNKSLLFNYTFWVFIVLKLTVRKKDIFIGHSGYFFTDHHGGWFSFAFLMEHWNNQFIILPQTINFYAPFVKQLVAKKFGNRENLTILCRDEVSYENAKKLFGSTKLLLFPDIVTSLIGARSYKADRDGVLFCMRDDVETFYSASSIDDLMNRFGNVRKEKIDTTLKISNVEMRKHRDELINKTIEKISTYKVVITDRYHGTIFSAIANTPVIVINSADHKLSSGVKWFPKEFFGENVQYAENLEDAYENACRILQDSRQVTANPAYFKEKYWDFLQDVRNSEK
ncbi:polysaccharide pyruvyl transferase family protein [Fibrobacter sp. UWH4]|uniref:polysaccharide pyruvyl transferase family protein n=1 Tax=Fibrobacter sp. UWH4 TaxID=1896210 RepID=UPI00091388DD|nr:polysaccharide pyruvyl transferase family protein [Fibrobacter sp. UWH4]SHK66108.1 Exopolysaccharide biosynthesis protein EpsI, predicted pyruvyl transferase [Fibrobacter sp. UWH4]